MLNLYDLFKRASPHIHVDQGIVDERHDIEGVRHLGFAVPPGARIVLKRLQEFRPLQRFPGRTGWTIFSHPAHDSPARLRVRLLNTGTGAVLEQRGLAARPGVSADVPLPWPALSAAPVPCADIELLADEGNVSPLFLSVTPMLDRSALIALCRGVGVEIGPGTNPQVLASDGVDVTYCDEMDREEWERTYAYKKSTWASRVDATPWYLYRRASAENLPVEDSSLDFIFASHVFEHLVNPRLATLSTGSPSCAWAG